LSSSAAATATAASAASAAQAAAQELDARASFGHFSQCTALVAAGSAARPLIVRYASQRRGEVSRERESVRAARKRNIQIIIRFSPPSRSAICLYHVFKQEFGKHSLNIVF
jgi:hypothetical protein